MSDPAIQIPRQLFLDLVWLQAFYSDQLNVYDGGGRRPVRLPDELARILTDRERSTRRHAGDEADAPRVALMLDAEELGAVYAACDIMSRSSGESVYFDAARRVVDRLKPYTLYAKGGQH